MMITRDYQYYVPLRGHTYHTTPWHWWYYGVQHMIELCILEQGADHGPR